MINVYNILLMISCYFTSNFIYSPTLSNVATDLGVGSEYVKATMTVFQAGALTSCIIAALFADFIGKKNFLVFGLTLATLGSIICIFAPDIYVLKLGRAIQGFGAAVGFMIGFALAVDLFKPEETLKIIALNGIIVSIVSVVSPYLGGYLAETFSWRTNFMVMASFFLSSQAASYIFLPAKANIRQPKLDLRRNLNESGAILLSLRYLSYASLNGILICGTIFSMSFIPFYYKYHFHLTSDMIGLILGSSTFGSFGIASIVSLRLNKRLVIDHVIRIGLTINISGSLLMVLSVFLFPDYLSLTISALIIYSFGFGLLYAGSITESMRVFLNNTTKASAVRTVMLTVGSFLGALVAQNMSELYPSNLAIPLIMTSIFSILMFSLRGRSTPEL